MLLDAAHIRQCLRDFNLDCLFIEDLGWDHHTQHLAVSVEGREHALNALAQKRGVVAFICATPANARIPDYATRRKIEQQVAKSVREHLIVYTDPAKTTQVWQWVKREAGKPLACREHSYHRSQSGDALIQKLQVLAFSLEEEEALMLPGVLERVRQGLDVEHVTKKFYDRFKTEHDKFEELVQGIPDEEMEQWYVSVMLNRLMFIYFVQKKGFLDDDTNYLRNRLSQSKRAGKDRFYRDFLCPLFFEGFAKKATDRTAATNALLGKVPYLNGGLFLRHQIEELHGRDIQIPDLAFTKIFAFFDEYQWHLDERPLREDREINPDVLGYIFEKYINQKQMGAYYTKEDITGYISQNTVIPFLFDAARQKCKIAFEGQQSVWRLLQADPDRYIYDAVKHGVALSLPKEIAAGLKDISKRTEWNKPAPSEYALPTEFWREVVARRTRYQEVRGKLANGEIRDINDLITYNLNIRQFAQDVIENCEGPELLRAFWHAIEKITVLDPTVGSGAFLFAALNVLEPLYEACLDRMQAFADELERSGEKHRPEKFGDFKEVLARIDKHPNRRYFILKSIVINNLYGVDIMEEATEICKLRLFLKLVAQVDCAEKIEPLPDIDFNIRAGNTLVGYTSLDHIQQAIAGDLFVSKQRDEALQRVNERAEDFDRLFGHFRHQQTELGGVVTPADKQALRTRLSELEGELNRYLATEYSIDPQKKQAYEKWRASHQPLHWFAEFYGILKDGGFSVVIGNPPYVEYSRVWDTYRIRNYKTEDCGNLYAFLLERSLSLISSNGRLGMIVPISLTAAQRMAVLQELLFASGNLHLSNYALRPAALFPGIMQRLTICLLNKGASGQAFTTDYITWYTEERPALFQQIKYVRVGEIRQQYSIPKVNNELSRSALLKILRQPRHWHSYREFKGIFTVYYHNAGGYWIKAFDFRPYYRSLVQSDKQHTTISELCMPRADLATVYLSLLNSSTFYFFWKSSTDARHVYPSDVAMLPIKLPLLGALTTELAAICKRLMDDYRRHRERIVYGSAEVDQFNVAPCKPTLDEIDRVLAKHYGFTDEELDFIINYDIKYRMGRDAEEDKG